MAFTGNRLHFSQRVSAAVLHAYDSDSKLRSFDLFYCVNHADPQTVPYAHLVAGPRSSHGIFPAVAHEHDLTEQQWRVIRILRQHGELESHQLANLACILKPSMTGVLSRLERDGIVRRRKSSEDQRRVFIALTEQGSSVSST